ncbi:MAG: NIPSNAP family protein, partial [Flavisolibacter sp.]
SIFFFSSAFGAPPQKDFYQIRVYHLKSNEQVQMVDQYLKNALVPALHRIGIKKLGVFQPLSNDTSSQKSMYVLIPFSSMKEFTEMEQKLAKDASYNENAQPFISAPSDHPAFERLESILLEAFDAQKHFVLPPKSTGNIYELRSYESPTLHLHEKKVNMFNKGEVDLFKRLDFRTVFYAKVISGSRMPNLIYMPCFTSVDERNAHWKTFGADPQWKQMSSDPENENKVSVNHIDSILMKATDYSDF